ncbi:MAG: DivIVA domain-containing protein [Actinomycetota bacterium]
MFRRRHRAPTPPPGDARRPEPSTHPFTVVRNGYAMPEVAAFVGRIGGDLGGLTPQDLRRSNFSIARRGYDKAEVIAYLNRIAAEVEAEIAQARDLARQERIATRAGIDPEGTTTIATPAPAPVAPPSPPTEELRHRDPIAATPEPETAPPPLAYTGESIDAELSSVMWIDEELSDEPAPPAPASTPSAHPATTPPPAPPTAVDAAGEIAALLRAAHDNARRLQDQTEADARHAMEAARADVEATRQTQERELAAERARVEHDHAARRHAAELEATAIRQRAEQDAATARAAAAAVLAQAKAEVEAVQALARHNLAEIELAKQLSIEQARQMLSIGKEMIATVIDLDHAAAQRLDASRHRTLQILDGLAG